MGERAGIKNMALTWRMAVRKLLAKKKTWEIRRIRIRLAIRSI